MKLFDYLKAMTSQKLDLDFTDDEVKRGYDQFMVNRFVSMCEVFLPFVNEINRFQLPKETHYRFFKTLLPKKSIYFDYIKKKKDTTMKEKRIVAKHYEVGLKEAEEYISLMSENQLKELLELYTYGKGTLADA